MNSQPQTVSGGVPYWRLSAYYFFYFAFVGAFSPYFGLYLQSIGQGAGEIALLMSLMSVMRTLAPTLWGWLADGLRMRAPIVRASALLAGLGFSGFLLTVESWGLLLSMGVLSFFWSAALPLVETLTFAHLQRQSQTGRYGNIRVWGSIGFVLAVLALGYGLDGLPIRALLWIILAILGCILLCALSIPEIRPEHAPAREGALGAVLRQPEVRGFLAACFCMSAAHGALYVFYSLHLVAHGYDKALVGWMWTLGVLAEIGVFMVMPQMLRRWSRRGVVLFTLWAAVLRFVLIGWYADSFAVLVFAQLLHGLTFGAYHASAIAEVNQRFVGPLQARGQALYGSVSFGAGGVLGGLISGYTWEPLGAAWTYSMSAAFALVGVGVLLRAWPRTPADAA